MPAISSALVIGSGTAGTAAAILLAEAGVAVDLAEIKAEVTALGSGITLQGNALLVLKRLGVIDECIELGQTMDRLEMRAPDPAASLIMAVDNIPFGGPTVPTTLGMYRPDLARILVERAEKVGVRTRFSLTATELRQDDDGVDVHFSDGSDGRYDLVVGADGVRSWTRRLLEIPLETRALGMGAFRMFAPRPADVDQAQLFVGGPCYIAGMTPSSADTGYWYLVEEARDRSGQTPEEMLADFVELSRAYHGPWDQVRDAFTDTDKIHYTWFEQHLLDAPWHRGRVVLIGDAVHVCPPTIAQGAAMAFEDALVLGELLTERDRLDDELWAAFTDRRFERVKTVVDASMQMAEWEMAHVQGDVPGLTRQVAQVVSRPA